MEKQKTPGEPGTYVGGIIEKSGPSAGIDTGLYLRLSMGDCAIRCSGSLISAADLRSKVDAHVTLRGEILSGEVKGLTDNGDYLLVTEWVD